MSGKILEKTIVVRAYLTHEGNPTCRLSLNESCNMLRAVRFGLEQQCCFQYNKEYLDRYFDKSVGEYGEYTYLKPFELCPIWKDENND